MEYSTFCCDNMETFQCKCGTSSCRKTVKGTDYLQSFLDKFEGHFTDYVETKRKNQKNKTSQ